MCKFSHTLWICNGILFELQYFFICIEIICQAVNPNRNMNFSGVCFFLLFLLPQHTVQARMARESENQRCREHNFFIKIYCVQYNLKLSCDHLSFLLRLLQFHRFMHLVALTCIAGHVHLSFFLWWENKANHKDTRTMLCYARHLCCLLKYIWNIWDNFFRYAFNRLPDHFFCYHLFLCANYFHNHWVFRAFCHKHCTRLNDICETFHDKMAQKWTISAWIKSWIIHLPSQLCVVCIERVSSSSTAVLRLKLISKCLHTLHVHCAHLHSRIQTDTQLNCTMYMQISMRFVAPHSHPQNAMRIYELLRRNLSSRAQWTPPVDFNSSAVNWFTPTNVYICVTLFNCFLCACQCVDSKASPNPFALYIPTENC